MCRKVHNEKKAPMENQSYELGRLRRKSWMSSSSNSQSKAMNLCVLFNGNIGKFGAEIEKIELFWLIIC
jgi:hypothetical protein